ncbi:MAG: tRNA (N6-threonylcarbamoyladenosine(37)-N6)-methyltransferase TrmO [Desulfobacterales bacterium]
MPQSYSIDPIGVVRKNDDGVQIEIFKNYAEGLLGLEGFSHIFVFYWFHQNDTPEKRKTLQVHPRKDPRNPLTGVFATHSPRRPNPIAQTLCKIVAITDHIIEIEEIDAYDGSPVIDLKCYVPASVEDKDVRQPNWIKVDREEAR